MTIADDAGQARRRGADRGLHRSPEPFRLLVESVVDYAIYMLDPDGIIESWNMGAERLKGYTPEEILGEHYSIFYPAQDRESGLPQHLLATARSLGRASHTGWRIRKDGTRFWADVVISAIRDDDGHLAGFAKVTRDMTDTVRAQEAHARALAEQERAAAHEEAEQWRRAFISTVAHDLQSPVTAIRGFAQIFAEEWPTSEDDHREFADRVLSNATSLQRLVDHLRTYTRLESGRVELRPERIALDDFVSRLLADMGPVLERHELVSELGPVEVQADPRGLERILRNLLGNAARHTPSRGTIRIRAGAEGDRVTVEVADEGEGIPEELLPHIFERFKHGGRGGTGLGLWIVKQYVELHDGVVSVDTAPGQGTTFGFSLAAA
jgi:PAS domain S-box-containing protein